MPSGSRDTIDGDGDNTMEGVRVCLCPVASFGCGVCISGRLEGFIFTGEVVDGDGDLVGSHSNPGLSIIFIVSPSFTPYSLRSFASASAFPLSKSRCASAGGAFGWEASEALTSDTVSVGCTASVNDCGGFVDLNVMLIDVARNLWLDDHQ